MTITIGALFPYVMFVWIYMEKWYEDCVSTL